MQKVFRPIVGPDSGFLRDATKHNTTYFRLGAFGLHTPMRASTQSTLYCQFYGFNVGTHSIVALPAML